LKDAVPEKHQKYDEKSRLVKLCTSEPTRHEKRKIERKCKEILREIYQHVVAEVLSDQVLNHDPRYEAVQPSSPVPESCKKGHDTKDYQSHVIHENGIIFDD
jgi:hypothetical protein